MQFLEIKGLDTKTGVRMSGGSPEAYMRTLAVFLRDGEGKISSIEKFLKSGEIAQFTIHIHALKSSLAIIGSQELSESARQLEMAGKKGDAAFISQNIEPFLSKLKPLLERIGQAMPEKRELSAADSDALNASLTKLREALDAFDIGEIDNSVREVREYSDVEGIESILTDVLIGEYDNATETIDRLLG